MKTTAVIFDVFGTVISIEDRRNPHLQLLRLGREHGRRPRPGDMQMIMTYELGWEELARCLDIRVSHEQLQHLAEELEAEVSSMQVCSDAAQAIALLQSAGVKVGLCSNLASGYGPAVRELLPGLDAYGFSYEIGAMKPNPIIYHSVCRDLGVQPGQQLLGNRVVMIGDSIKCDRDGARAAGIAGLHLSRTGKADFTDLVKFAESVVQA
ncbi:HAD family hydrolase [Pseudomonas sp. CNPSo 3701]|uniref:HAD family hydrolase n=1 Tax=Pseudomonas sp. CNPSo 3701 TaxID=3027943 RepID=UPI00236474B7|nr:HAD family hydrolase [Pseudomonas sp. CNPSo 3701]MDD1507714.1 HAD family hydrolase [Pseudomonas sp. CNPSo 3701]